jgi:biopolymer transport protein ExbB/TolQ
MTHALSPTTDDASRPARPAQKRLWIGLALILAGPVVGLLSTLLGMVDSYRTIESERAPTPADLGVGVHISMFGSAAGLLVSLVGVVLVVWAVVQIVRASRLPA